GIRDRNVTGVQTCALPISRESERPPCTSMCYLGTLVRMESNSLLVERVQTGVRIEKRLVKVLKAFAEYHDLTLGDLLEGIVLHEIGRASCRERVYGGVAAG